MALSICNTLTDRSGRELLEHGSPAFPISCYRNTLDESVPWHWHDEWEAILITGGSATVAAGNKTHILKDGEGIFINSGILHGMWAADTRNGSFHSLVFHPKLVGGSMDSVFYQQYIQPLIKNRSLECMILRPALHWQKSVLDSIETAWRSCVQESQGYEFQVRNALSDLVCQIWCNTSVSQQGPSAKVLRDGERMKKMLQYIHDHCGEEFNTQLIAASALISESECLRCFHSIIGTTPIQYVKQYRIQRAALLLSSTQEKISDISVSCGFQDLSYFTKTFRELKGCTPTEYRRRNLKQGALCTMNIETVTQNGVTMAIVTSDRKIVTDVQSALDLVMTAKYDAGTKNIVLDKRIIAEEFFILSSGLAGEILQKFINYGVRCAIYGDYSHYTSKPLKDFIYESNQGKDVFFTATKEEGLAMLSRK